jgi:membrane protein DedA with SNARE-associated domain
LNAWIIIIQNAITVLKSGHLPEWGHWTYLILAVLVAVEGPIATLLGAAAASAGLMRPSLVFVAASMGNLTADSLWYTIGYLGKIEWLFRFGKRMGINQNTMESMQKKMRKHTTRLLFLAKLSMSLMIPSLIAAGLVKAPWRRWFPGVFSGEMIWTGTLVLIGYYATEAIKRVEKGLEYVIIAATIAFVAFVFWYGRRILQKSTANASKPESGLEE